MLFFACEAARRGLFCRRKSGRISAREKAETAKAAAPGRIPPDFTSHRDFRAPKSGGEFLFGRKTLHVAKPPPESSDPVLRKKRETPSRQTETFWIYQAAPSCGKHTAGTVRPRVPRGSCRILPADRWQARPSSNISPPRAPPRGRAARRRRPRRPWDSSSARQRPR